MTTPAKAWVEEMGRRAWLLCNCDRSLLNWLFFLPFPTFLILGNLSFRPINRGNWADHHLPFRKGQVDSTAQAVWTISQQNAIALTSVPSSLPLRWDRLVPIEMTSHCAVPSR